MSDGTYLAIALILFWMAGVALFVAFHPGGVEVNGKPAQNPADVVRYLISVAGKGEAASGGVPVTVA
jgi:hypothetical protein